MKLEPVRRVLEHLSAPYALIGAHAMAARGYPRFTVDIDLLTTDSRVLDRGIWTDLERSGATIDARRGGVLDLRDAAALLALGDRDRLVSQVEAHLSDVRPDVRDVWSQVLAATP